MQITLSIHIDNDAFGDNAGDEIARILRDAADKVEGSPMSDAFDRSFRLVDINGNTVGAFKGTR